MAGAQHSVEATIDALIAKLQAELPAKIKEINDEIGDEYVLEAPAGISFGPRNEIPYPWIIIAPESSENLTESSGRLHYDHAIAATVYLAEPDEETLTRKLIRYQRAVREVCVHFRRPGASPVSDDPGGYWLGYVRDVYGPFMQDQDENGAPIGAVISWNRTTFNAKQQQDF